MPDDLLVRLAVRLLTIGSALAPAWRRDDWLREWLAEVEFRARRLAAHRRLTVAAQLRLLARCAGAVFHLIFLWQHDWSLDMFTQDVRYGLRLLVRRPAFSVMAIATLALGIGATTAIFSAVHTILLKPLPYPAPQQLVRIAGLDLRTPQATAGNLSVPDAMDFQRQATSLQALGAFNSGGYFTLTGAGDPARTPRLLVTSGYFRVLGTQPAQGRLFRADEDRPSPPAVVVISDGLWRRRFGADPSIVGRTITLSGIPSVVIGVTPATFVHPDPKIEAAPDVFALLDPDEQVSSRSGRYVRAIARLKDDVPVARAAAELQTIAATLDARYPQSNRGRSTMVLPLTTATSGDARTPLLVLQAATVAILLIACANLANLLLGAAAGRTGELTIRAALGAGRARIVRQLLTESLVLASIGGAAGVVLAHWSTAWLTAAAGSMLLPGQRLTVDTSVLGFALSVSVLVGLGFGLVPALYAARPSSVVAHSRRHTAGRGEQRLRAVLIAGEVAISVLLLVGAVLLIRSFRELTLVDPGFRAARVLSFQLAVQPTAYPSGRPSAFYDRLYPRLRQLPGVATAGGVNILPLSGNYSCDGMQIEGHEVPKGQEPCAEVRSASPEYFQTLGIPLRRGRLFTPQDDERSRRVIVINETLARRFFPNDDPIGRRIVYAARGQNDPREIVGIVGDVHHFGLDTPPSAEFYTPEAQPPSFGGMTIVMQVDGDPLALVPSIRGVVHELAPDAPIYNVRTVEQLVGASVAGARVRTLLLGAFAGLALLLAVVGIYGVISLAVSQRTREMGIRLALGASSRDILRLVVFGGLRPMLLGGAAGLIAATVVARAIRGLLFNVSPLDRTTFVLATAIVLAAGLAATWIPARRACRVNPVGALRAD